MLLKEPNLQSQPDIQKEEINKIQENASPEDDKSTKDKTDTGKIK
jgi:hypothetical protein